MAATNEFLEEMVEKGSFRRDLYYRLNALPVLIPPLRERGDDIFLLFERFFRKAGGTYGLSDEVRELFRRYKWPGNVRELQNVAVYLGFAGQEEMVMFTRAGKKDWNRFVRNGEKSSGLFWNSSIKHVNRSV